MITLNVNGLNSPNKRLGMADWIKIKIQLFAAYKRFISVLRTHRSSKWNDEKRYSLQVEIKSEQGELYLYKTK